MLTSLLRRQIQYLQFSIFTEVATKDMFQMLILAKETTFSLPMVKAIFLKNVRNLYSAREDGTYNTAAACDNWTFNNCHFRGTVTMSAYQIHTPNMTLDNCVFDYGVSAQAAGTGCKILNSETKATKTTITSTTIVGATSITVTDGSIFYRRNDCSSARYSCELLGV